MTFTDAPRDRKVKFWVVMKATRAGYGTYQQPPYDGQTKIHSIRAAKMTVNKPALAEDEICFQMEVDVSEAWFLDGSATVKAALPAPPQDQSTVQAQVDMPVRGRAKSSAAGAIKP